MKPVRMIAVLSALVLLIAACSTGGASPSASSAAPSAAPTTGGASADPSAAATPTVDPSSLLGTVLAAGKIRVSTDPNYAPQSVQKPDGSYEGFDIDVANEVAKRLGVTVEFVTPDWSVITAGGWGGRWDMSVGSMTVTSDRQKVLDFTEPYYYTPAQLTASTASGITTLDALAGKTICAGEATTYLDWLEGKKLDFGSLSPTTTPPAGAKAVTQKTDQQCPQLWASGRNDFEGWLSSSTTVDAAIKAGMPVVKVGDPVYFEPLAIAVDKSGPDTSAFVARVSEIIKEMHDDGTLKGLSEKWLGGDLTQGPAS